MILRPHNKPYKPSIRDMARQTGVSHEFVRQAVIANEHGYGDDVEAGTTRVGDAIKDLNDRGFPCCQDNEEWKAILNEPVEDIRAMMIVKQLTPKQKKAWYDWADEEEETQNA